MKTFHALFPFLSLSAFQSIKLTYHFHFLPSILYKTAIAHAIAIFDISRIRDKLREQTITREIIRARYRTDSCGVVR